VQTIALLRTIPSFAPNPAIHPDTAEIDGSLDITQAVEPELVLIGFSLEMSIVLLLPKSHPLIILWDVFRFSNWGESLSHFDLLSIVSTNNSKQSLH
jgi:hypothetical protein